MNDSKSLGIVFGILAAVALIGLAVYGGIHLLSGSAASSAGRGGDSNFDSVVLDTTLTVGATTTVGTAGTCSYFLEGGYDRATCQQTFTATSAVPVAFSNPYGSSNSTSSIDRVVCAITQGVLGANTFDLSTSTTAYGSSTPALLYAHSVATGASDYFVWQPSKVASSTVTIANSVFTQDNTKDGRSPFILAPTEKLTVRVASSSPGTFAGGYFTGSCTAQFSKP